MSGNGNGGLSPGDKRHRHPLSLDPANDAGSSGTRGEDDLLAVVMEEVRAELVRATEMFGPFNSDHEGLGVLLEEWHELIDAIRANSPRAIEKEAIQVAAMAARLVLDGRWRALAAIGEGGDGDGGLSPRPPLPCTSQTTRSEAGRGGERHNGGTADREDDGCE